MRNAKQGNDLKVSKAVGVSQHSPAFTVDFQVQSILTHLETPYSDDMEDKEASFYQTSTGRTFTILGRSQRKNFSFNFYDKQENFLVKPPDQRKCAICDSHDPRKLSGFFLCKLGK